MDYSLMTMKSAGVTKMFGVMVELYKNRNEDSNVLRLGSIPYETREEAQKFIDEARRHNLPYKNKWIIEFNDPRESEAPINEKEVNNVS